MFDIGSRTHYALWHGIVFNFEYVRDRDYFVDNAKDAKVISAHQAYHLGISNCVRVRASCALQSNNERRIRINKWYDNKRCRV